VKPKFSFANAAEAATSATLRDSADAVIFMDLSRGCVSPSMHPCAASLRFMHDDAASRRRVNQRRPAGIR
jgi:hypothetical protein